MTAARTELPTIRFRGGPEPAAVLRVAAKVVLTIGLLVAGFIVYEFGVTSYFANRAQVGLRSELSVRLDSAEVTAVPFVSDARPENPFSLPTDLPAFDPSSVPGLASSAAGSATLPGEVFGDGLLVSEPVPAQGEALGRIVIPTAGVDWTVVEGVSRDDLKTGAGHMPDTAMPGQPGNTVISGHRTTYGAPFLHLDRVQVGDLVTVESATGVHVYQVMTTLVVDPSETWVTTQWDGSWLTLTTCEPVLSAAQRLIVVASLVAGPNADVIHDS